MSELGKIVVVGASLAGLRAVETLRQCGYTGDIDVVGAERHLPYDRPPLSKELLAGKWEADRLALRAAPYEELDARWLLGTPGESLDLEERTVRLADGSTLSYEGLIIATGAHPRPMPGAPDLDGVLVLRTLDDALALRERLDRQQRVVVIGAGFIGAEVAATCRGRGLDVTVLEAMEQPMVRGVGPIIGAELAALHRNNGVDLRCGVTVESIVGTERVEGVRLATGETIPADAVLVAIGAVPTTQWLESSGLTLDNGVVCDETLLAAPGVVAIGDVARWPNALFDGAMMRLEHWTNASESAAAAVQRLLASDNEAVPFAPIPFVWSDQYSTKIQSVGVYAGDDEMVVAHGSFEEGKFVALFGRAGRLVGAIGFGRPRFVMQYRAMIGRRASFDEAVTHATSG